MTSLVPTFFFLAAGSSLILAAPDCDGSCIRANQFEVKIDIEGNEINLSWKFNQSKQIYGFQAKIYSSGDSILYQSPILHVSQRSMKLEHELDGDNKICITVLENSTNILDEKCEKIEIKDLKIIIGILAGTIFLIPCLLALSYVICKDYKVRQLENYEKMSPLLTANEEDIIVGEVKKSPNPRTKTVDSDNTKDNKAFVMDEDLKQQDNVDRETSQPSKETAAVDISNTETEKSRQSNVPMDNPETVSRSLGKDDEKAENSDELKDSEKVADTLEVINEAKMPDVTVTDEEVLGTSL